MEINGERVIGASQQTVWDAINDPEILKLCIPGGESVERTGDNEMKAVVMAKIGPVRARFSGKMTMLDVVAPNSCKLVFEGTGGPAGFAKGQATVSLMAQGPNETLLVFSCAATVGGKLGQIGARLIESAARTISDEFFSNMKKQLSPGTDESESAADAAKPSGKPVAAPAPAAGATATAAADAPRKPAVSVKPVAAPGYIVVDTRWIIAIGCLVLGFLAGKIL
ncbi:MAG TPA: carbon monoxide dehydrogenase subunit G [Herbaspirillum sp.]|jgi:carbon monoxide dehydrogenase subunit G